MVVEEGHIVGGPAISEQCVTDIHPLIKAFFILDANFPHNTTNLKQICVSSKLTRHENNHLPKVWAPIIAALSLTERSKLVLKKSTVSSPLVTVFKCVCLRNLNHFYISPTFSSMFLKIVLELWKRFWRGRLSGAVDCKHPNQIRILRWSNIVVEDHEKSHLEDLIQQFI